MLSGEALLRWIVAIPRDGKLLAFKSSSGITWNKDEMYTFLRDWQIDEDDLDDLRMPGSGSNELASSWSDKFLWSRFWWDLEMTFECIIINQIKSNVFV